jgi:hypothetical protein
MQIYRIRQRVGSNMFAFFKSSRATLRASTEWERNSSKLCWQFDFTEHQHEESDFYSWDRVHQAAKSKRMLLPQADEQTQALAAGQVRMHTQKHMRIDTKRLKWLIDGLTLISVCRLGLTGSWKRSDLSRHVTKTSNRSVCKHAAPRTESIIWRLNKSVEWIPQIIHGTYRAL